jgi:hypothetical protein
MHATAAGGKVGVWVGVLLLSDVHYTYAPRRAPTHRAQQDCLTTLSSPLAYGVPLVSCNDANHDGAGAAVTRSTRAVRGSGSLC